MPSPLRSLSPPPPRKRPRLNPPPLLPRREPTIPPAATNHVRIYSWNINGIASFLQYHTRQRQRQRQRPITSFFSPPTSTTTKVTPVRRQDKEPAHSLRGCLRRWKYPEIVCLQEVKIRHDDEVTKRVFQEAVNDLEDSDSDSDSDSLSGPDNKSDSDNHTHQYTIRFSLPHHHNPNARGRIYGVATLIRTDFLATHVRQTRPATWDTEGRVLLTELESGILVLNVYAVNGTDNVWRDSGGSGAVLGTRHDAKIKLHDDLAREWRAWEDSERDVVMIGDLNVARDSRDGYPGIRLGEQHVRNRADFERKFLDAESGLDAVDAFRYVHGDERKYSYFSRGRLWGESCDRVDLCLVSRGLVNGAALADQRFVNGGALVGADILDSKKERGPSDHVPLYVTLKIDPYKDIGTRQ